MKLHCSTILLLIAFFSSFNSAFSQNINGSNRFEIEADPLAYIFNGHSIHVAYNVSPVRFSFGSFGFRHPGFLLDNDAFQVRTFGFDIKVDYSFGNIKGFFVGAQSTYSRDRIGLKESTARQEFWGSSFAVRTGYRFMLGNKHNDYKGLYIVPWLALNYSPNAKSIVQNNHVYNQTKWFPFPTVHIGWRL
jgi:hypothetical protein